MRVSGYISPIGRLANPTGVGQHAMYMFEQLASRLGDSFSLLTSKQEYHRAKTALLPMVQASTANYLYGSDRLRRMLSVSLGVFPVDVAAGLNRTDWVYCPKEQPVCVRRARLAVTVHDVLAFEPPIRGLPRTTSWSQQLRTNRVMRRVIDKADVILTVSEFTAGRLEELFGVPRERCVVIGNGVADRYLQEPEVGDQELLKTHGVSTGKFFMSIGSLTRRKGGDTLVQLAERMLQRGFDDYSIIISGRRHDSDLLEQYEQLRARRPNLPLRLAGYISDREQSALLRHSAALLFPSRYEGFGIPVLEAMAAGTRVICSDHPAVQEVAGGLGVTVCPDSVDSLFDAMRRIVEEPNSIRVDAIQIAQRRSRKFTWQACCTRLVTALQER